MNATMMIFISMLRKVLKVKIKKIGVQHILMDLYRLRWGICAQNLLVFNIYIWSNILVKNKLKPLI